MAAKEWEESSELVQGAWKQMRTIQLPRPTPLKSKKLDFSDSTSPTFQCFSSLAIELKDIIWRFALPEPTLVDLRDEPDSSHEPNRHWHLTVPTPVLLGVCRESRAVVLKHYECAFKDENGKGGICIDFKVDVFSPGNFNRLDGSRNLDDFKEDFQKIRTLVLTVDGMQSFGHTIRVDRDRIVGWRPKNFAVTMKKLEHITLVNLDDDMLHDLLDPHSECNRFDDISRAQHMSPTHDDYTMPYDLYDPHNENNLSNSGDMHSEFFNLSGKHSTRYGYILEMEQGLWLLMKYNSKIPF
jgi:hypothetical protein